MITRRWQIFSGQPPPPKQIPFYSSRPTPMGLGPRSSAGTTVCGSPAVPPLPHPCVCIKTLHPGSYLPHEREMYRRASPPVLRAGPRNACDPSFEAVSSLGHPKVPPSSPVVVHRHHVIPHHRHHLTRSVQLPPALRTAALGGRLGRGRRHASRPAPSAVGEPRAPPTEQTPGWSRPSSPQRPGGLPQSAGTRCRRDRSRSSETSTVRHPAPAVSYLLRSGRFPRD